ncbi:tetratricopeptide repeat protein, partial [Bradyrhizobium sp. NBAIM08]|uniref:tetratricopeptide repeat protein n=1 Tax=Bradyrhizobium sp. NBAIM08 TaxID=2793815 RepID=UPI001CD73C7B
VLMDQANDALQEGDFEQSLKLANASLKLRRTARAHLVKAQALQRLSRVEDALSAIDDAEALSPRFPMVFELRGRILWAARREDEARIAFEQFLELSPNGATAAQIRRLLDRPR